MAKIKFCPWLFILAGILTLGWCTVFAQPSVDNPGTRFDIIEDFESGSVSLQSWLTEDVSPSSWQLTTSDTYNGSAYSLQLYGNTWKQEMITPVIVDSLDVFQVAAKTVSGAKVQGIGFSDGTHVIFYSLSGTLVMNIEQWVPVYQGAFDNNVWNLYQLPIADDWYSLFDYLPVITSVIYVNDLDGVSNRNFFVDFVLNISSDIDVAPEVQITHQITLQGERNNGMRDVGVQFFSTVTDPDSDTFLYEWDFGDSLSSTETNPYHNYLVEDDHPYTVSLKVTDSAGKWGLGSCQIAVDAGTGTLPIRMNFVGDIMLARRYDQAGGIIPTQGVNAIFAPTLDLLGNAADVTVANLEVVLTDQGEHHPTKSVYYRGNPANVSGLVYAGIDVVNLANNHVIDYGWEGFEQMRGLLDANDLIYSGAGEDSYEAYTPAFINRSGLNIAFLASCDRTGQYNNAQPYLQAGYDKYGFAYMTPYYMLQQLAAVDGVADLKVMELHSGSEYSLAPGSGYDKNNPFTGDDQDEDYNPKTDVPHMWDVAIRHFAIDSGADLVIVHHSHIIQAFEVYQGKLICHSLGNFIFDLDYPETMPSMIFYADADESGFSNYKVVPIYIDDYIPKRATGQLGKYILDYIAQCSTQFNTKVLVDYNDVTATIPVNDTDTQISAYNYNYNQTLTPVTGLGKVTAPFKLPRYGSINAVNAIEPVSDAQYRLGAETIWYGNFEDEGSTLWSVDTFSTTDVLDGQRAAMIAPSSGQTNTNTISQRCKWYDNTKKYTLHGWIKTRNASNVNIIVRYYNSRTSGILSTENLTTNITGSTSWTWYYKELTIPTDAWYYDIRLTCTNAGGTNVYALFDNVGLIEWTPWTTFQPMNSIPNPNNYYWMQVLTNENPKSVNVLFTEQRYTATDQRKDSVPSLSSDLKVYPNPFSESANISFSVAVKGKTTLSIYNLRGQKVRTLIDGDLPDGKHNLTWDGRDEKNQREGSGIYLLRLEQDCRSEVHKIILLH
jgi:poly-gamma-glutamate capsule biosynthesis protein CapA/YwtB (metallophosphatase superfamily)